VATLRVHNCPREHLATLVDGKPRAGAARRAKRPDQLRRLAEKMAALAACKAQHPQGYQAQVVVDDFSTGEATPFLPVRAVRWELAPASGLQHVLETEAVQDETISFWGPAPRIPTDRSA
jgi:hypothetical protein